MVCAYQLYLKENVVWNCSKFNCNTYFSASRSDVKLKLEVNGFNLGQCTNVYRRASISLGQNVLCAGGEEGKDSCSGDSGDLIDFQFDYGYSNSIFIIFIDCTNRRPIDSL